MGWSHKTLSTLSSYPCTRARVSSPTVWTTGVSHCTLLLVRFWPMSCWTGSNTCQKHPREPVWLLCKSGHCWHDKSREQNITVYAAFIDLIKAFDTELWGSVENLSMPRIPTQVPHNGQLGQVKLSGNLCDTFPLTNGVKGVSSLWLYSLFSSA